MRFLAVAAALATIAAAPVGAPAYILAAPIAGPDGGWDYARVDSSNHKLYVARTTSVTAIDLATGEATSFGTLARGHAVLPLPGGRLLVTSGNDGTVRFFDTARNVEIASIAVGKKPDAAIYDPKTRRAYVMNADSGTISVIDTAAMRVVRTITAKPALEYAAIAKDGTLFVNNEDANEIEAVDIATGKLGAPIALAGCEGPTGLAYDARRDRLISACGNGKLAIVDAGARRVAAMLDIGKGADAVILDEARRLAFVPCGRDGTLDIVSLDAAPARARIASVTTEVGARTGAIDPATGTLYLPSARFAPPAQPGARPAPLPGSFHAVVVRRNYPRI